jgi:hypothetical protein
MYDVACFLDPFFPYLQALGPAVAVVAYRLATFRKSSIVFLNDPDVIMIAENRGHDIKFTVTAVDVASHDGTDRA